ncbi:MAG TPA: glycosyltransferase family 39 protein [Acidimicrobiales bacterium]|nr:glycosyltransferase family 39 protein [Acidimicrobiales bacterium]
MHIGYRGEETLPDPSDERLAPALDGGSPEPVLTAARPRVSRWQLAAVTVIAVGVAVRFAARSNMWLDEVLSVNIARLPLGEIPDALRRDGAPPLYYLLLHGWTAVVGTGTLAVRALSGIFALAALPLIWVAGRRVGGRATAHAALVLLAASPFAVRYSTEARMYSMLVVLALAGWLLFDDLLKRFSWPRAGALALLTGAALLTHYWSFYLLAVATGAACWHARRGPQRAEARRVLATLGAGCALFLPWLPSFVYQLRHTGTPWARPAGVKVLFDTPFQFVGGLWDPGFILGLVAWGLIALALLGRPLDGRRVELDLRIRPEGRALAVAAFGTLGVGIVAGLITQAAFAVRYTAILFPFVVLLVALGTSRFVDPRVYRGVLALAVVLGGIAMVPGVFGERTTAPKVARVLNAEARPGDVVAYCPDQLGPSVHRLLDARGLVQLTFPTAGPPDRVDWVDYGDRNRAARVAPFTQMLLDRAGPDHDIWLVWSPGYRTFSTKCSAMADLLEETRPEMTRRVKVSTRYFEHPGLIRFEPSR